MKNKNHRNVLFKDGGVGLFFRWENFMQRREGCTGGGVREIVKKTVSGEGVAEMEFEACGSGRRV